MLQKHLCVRRLQKDLGFDSDREFLAPDDEVEEGEGVFGQTLHSLMSIRFYRSREEEWDSDPDFADLQDTSKIAATFENALFLFIDEASMVDQALFGKSH